jgi:hypothetical protein
MEKITYTRSLPGMPGGFVFDTYASLKLYSTSAGTTRKVKHKANASFPMDDEPRRKEQPFKAAVDSFYSEANIAYLARAYEDVKAGRGMTVRELIEDANDRT